MHSQIKKHFDQSTSTYRQNAVVQARAALKCVSLIPDRKFDIILEIGAGGGLLTSACLKQRSRPELYVALDISRKMLQLTPESEVARIQADGEKSPFRPHTFDLLVSSSAMQWYYRGTDSIISNTALLKPGGFFSLAFFVQGTFREMAHISHMTGFGSIYPLPSAEKCLQQLKSTGLIFEHLQEEHKLYFSSPAHFLKSHKKTGATYTASSSISFSKINYMNFCKMYQQIYGSSRGIPASFTILHLWGTRE